MISFQKETRLNTSYWVLGDSFMRAFYTIYDAENKRIGLVGDTEIVATETSQEEDADAEFNPLIYILPGAICLLCVLAICISICITYRIRRQQISL